MTDIPTERHPLEPFLPDGARILMLGSFPPARKRWSMDFFYPNWINDMWRIWGLIFHDDKEYFVAEEGGKKVKRFDRERCAGFATEKGIAMYDTACEVRRLKDNASDKFLEIVRPTNISSLTNRLPQLKAIVTTGEKATDILCSQLSIDVPPAVGHSTPVPTLGIELYRLPSSSRAYPLAMEKKALAYRDMFVRYGIDMRL